MNKKILVLIFLSILLTSGCATQDKIKELQSVEVREYNGENLSSFVEVRDASIKGPQKIDISTYKLEVSGLVKEEREYTYDQVINNHQKYQKLSKYFVLKDGTLKISGKEFYLKIYLMKLV